MPFTQYKTIADVLAEFPMTYQEASFLEHHALAIDPAFSDRLQLVLTEGIVFNRVWVRFPAALRRKQKACNPNL